MIWDELGPETQERLAVVAARFGMPPQDLATWAIAAILDEWDPQSGLEGIDAAAERALRRLS